MEITPKEIAENPMIHLDQASLLQTALTNMNMSTRAFAKHANMERGRLSKIASGRATPTQDEMEKISAGMQSVLIGRYKLPGVVS